MFFFDWATVQSECSSLFHLFTWLPYFWFCVSQSVSLAPRQQATTSIHCPALRLLFSLLSLHRKHTSVPTASTGTTPTISEDNQKSNSFQLNCVCVTHGKSIRSIKRMSYYCHRGGYIFTAVSLSLVSRISQKMWAYFWHLTDRSAWKKHQWLFLSETTKTKHRHLFLGVVRCSRNYKSFFKKIRENAENVTFFSKLRPLAPTLWPTLLALEQASLTSAFFYPVVRRTKRQAERDRLQVMLWLRVTCEVYVVRFVLNPKNPQDIQFLKLFPWFESAFIAVLVTVKMSILIEL